MNKHQMDKCRAWVDAYLPVEGEPIQPKEYFVQHLYEFIMPYRRNVQNLKKKIRYMRGAYNRKSIGDEKW